MTNTLQKIMHDGDEYNLPEGFSPGNAGTTGQVLTKTNDGYEYADAPVTSVNSQTGAVTISETVVSGDSGVTYTIKTSNSAPAAGTPNTTITLVF